MKTGNREQGSGIRIAILLLAICGWLASCGGSAGPYAFAQAPAPLPLGTFYSPETNLEALDVTALGSAKHSIDLAAFSLTDKALIATLLDRAAHGVTVRIYLDRGELQAECRGDVSCTRSPLHALLGVPGIQIKVKFSKVLMHLKNYEVDSVVVRDGSANFSEQGEQRQDNSAIFEHGPESGKVFEGKFQGMWARADNLTVAGAVKSP